MKWTRILFVSLLAAGTAQAEDFPNAFGIKYGTIDQGERFSNAGITSTIETGDIMLDMVGDVNRYTAVNLRIGTSLEGEELTVAGTPLEVKHDRYAGVYLRLKYPVAWLTPYVQGGFVRMKETIKLGNTSTSDEFNDASYAGGLDIQFGERWMINAEYFLLSEKNGVKRRGPTAGIYYRF